MPWQRQVADVATELLPDGSWAYPVVVLTVQRQAGKTTLVGPANVELCTVQRDARSWFTQQTRQDARDTLIDGFGPQVAASPLASRVRLRKSNGSEGLWFPGGGTFRIFAPTGDALHGKANHRVTVDELWAFDGQRGLELEQAILPTFTTTGGQLWLVSAGGTAESGWLAAWVEKGRAAVASGRTTGVAFFEFGLPPEDREAVEHGLEAGKLDPESPEFAAALSLVLDAHPANGFTLNHAALRTAAESMRVGEFLRAYANLWTAAGERVIPASDWAAAELDPELPWPKPSVPVGLGFDVSLDRQSAAITAAWRLTPDGPIRWDVIDARPGTSWVVPKLVELSSSWRPAAIAHFGGPALDLADAATRAGLSLLHPSGVEYTTACQSVLTAITTPGRFLHHGQPELDAAVAAAAKRESGDGAWLWSRRNSAASIAPLVAGTVAGWAFDHAPKAVPPLVIRSRATRPRVPGFPELAGRRR